MIDLHTHTKHSDGTDSVEELLKNAENKNIELLSITDHDSVGAYLEMEEKPELRKLFSGKIIAGIEMKTHYNRVPIEVLGYGIDYKNIKIHQSVTLEIKEKTLEKLKEVARNLGLKFDEEETIIDENNPTKKWGAFTMATELLKYEENKEIIKQVGEFTTESFYRVHQSNKESPFFIDETESYIDINETIARIHQAGGLAFLAHGYLYPFPNKLETIEEILTTTEIDGLECKYNSFTKEEEDKIIELCKKHNKLVSGGTDYHAKNKPNIELGTGINNNMNIGIDFIKDWIDRVEKI